MIQLSILGLFVLCFQVTVLFAAEFSTPLIPNGNFKGKVFNGIPEGWIWGSSSPKAKVTCRVVSGGTGAGGKSVKLTSNQPVEPNVYGCLGTELQGIEPMTEYQVTLYVRAKDHGGNFWFGGGRDWKWHNPFPAGTYSRRRMDSWYRTGPDERSLKLIIGAEGKGQLWIDSIQVVRMGRSTDPTVKPPIKARTREQILNALAPIREKLGPWQKQIEALRKNKANTDYPQIKLSLIESFIPRIETRVRDEKYLLPCTVMILELEQVAKGLDDDLAALEKNPRNFPTAPRYRTGKIETDGYTQLADVFDPATGKTTRRPVIFTGFGNFFTVCDEVGQWQNRGCNVISPEMGPTAVISAAPDGSLRVDDKPIRKVVENLKAAARNNVAVVFLISPHYMPNFAGAMWYSDAPKVRQILETYLRRLIPQIKDIPSLHSIILSNEPCCPADPKDPLYVAGWHQFLKARYATIENLNRTYGQTTYPDFDQVPLPASDKTSVGSFEKKDRPWFSDWMQFHTRRFADWHKFLADTIHELAPNLPVHAKMTGGSMMGMGLGEPALNGIDPEMFAKFTHYNGFDEVGGVRIIYDLQQSFHQAPCVNSENHLLNPDGNYDELTPQAFYCDLFAQAMHGQTVSTAWVYEPNCEPMSLWDFSIRPALMDAVGRVGLDLMRAAPALAAIQNTPREVAIIYSPTSFAYNEDYHPAWRTAWEAFSNTGLRVRFLSENQIQAGTFGEVRVLILPEAQVVQRDTLKGLKNFVKAGGKIVAVGRNLEYTPGWLPIDPKEVTPLISEKLNRQSPKWPQELTAWVEKSGIKPLVMLSAAKGNKPAGIHWLCGTLNGKKVLAVINLSGKPANITINRPQTQNAFDLITDHSVKFPFELKNLGTAVWRID